MILAQESQLIVLLVIYNATFEGSATLTGLIKQQEAPDLRLVIWDNSPSSQMDWRLYDELSAKVTEIHYVHTPENTPLSVLYNRVVREWPAELYVFLDQDSAIGPDFLAGIHAAAQKRRDIMVFVPRLVFGGRLVSPGAFGTFKGRELRAIEPGVQATAGRTVMTSGMTVRRQVFDTGLWFNEVLWLYMIDTDFFLRFRARYDRFWVLEETVQHGSALRSDMNLEQRLLRFRNLRWSYLVVMRQHGRVVLAPLIYMLLMSLSRAVRFRSFRFLSGWSRDR